MTPGLQAEYARRCDTDSDIREYLPLLYAAASRYPGARVQEIGVRTGNSTIALLAGAEISGGHVWSVDIADVLGKDGGMGPWRGCLGWSFTLGPSTSPQVLTTQPPEIDVLFIDSSHTYRETLAELEAYMPRLAPGGTALFHDTRLHLAGERPYPVAQALNAWCSARRRSWRDLPGQYGLGVITGAL